METDLKELEKQLQEHAVELEKKRLSAHEAAMAELAEARKKEEERQAEARKAQEEANAKAERRRAEKREAEAAQLREEDEARRLTEQEENKQQEAIDNFIQMKERIRRQLDEIEHAEELAKKQLRDLIMNGADSTSSERIMPNPLEKFLQKEPS